MDRWAEFELFVQIAELGSLSKAAEAIDVSNATASRYLESLEQRLGVRLVDRTTRRLGVTAAGEDFYHQCKQALGTMREAEAAINATALHPSGTLRITSSELFCMKLILPLLPEFMALYPEVDVQLVSASRYFDFIESGIDIAIRTREYEVESNITVRRLARTRRVVVASPAYLARHGTPRTIDELTQHKLLLYSYVQHPNELHFSRGGETQVLKVKSLLEANDGLLLQVAALDGMGILIQPMYAVYDDLCEGRLVPLLEDWELPLLSINIAYQTRKHLPAKVRAFIDFMSRHFEQNANERKWMSR
ncbi:LysR family transcriptional regulator [Pigmentiphaga sp. H8]|uniref:LysR family transcriptional regulator n=1 Tax=unclassified Pigmentiphaga TaxID=2626614 RepID=UPI000F594D1A|nr:LysR family transcriptional regulator [Pigmentiphaga sp. H8]AZG09744.1 LysR family transcriptional regulator [Pigmentiphaga sp. H8]